MPLDPFSEYAALRMQQVDGAPDDVTEVHQEIWGIVTPKLPEAAKMSSIKRPDFYIQAANCFAVVHCGEVLPLGYFILRGGVILKSRRAYENLPDGFNINQANLAVEQSGILP